MTAPPNLEEVKQALRAPVVSIRKGDDEALRIRTAAARAYVDLIEGAEQVEYCLTHKHLPNWACQAAYVACEVGRVRLVPVSEETP